MTLYRILHDPGADAAGSAPTPEPAGADAPAEADADLVSLPRAELEALRAAASASASRTLEADDRLRRQAERHAEELAAKERRLADWERSCKAALREKELATALAGRPLVPGGAAQLVSLWRDELEVIDEAGRLRVVSRDGKPVAEAVAAWLGSPEYAHFCRASSRGGTAAPGDARSAAPGPPPGPPKTLGEAALLRWREAAAGPGPEAPIGLGRRRG